jgi:hypothetical protein
MGGIAAPCDISVGYSAGIGLTRSSGDTLAQPHIINQNGARGANAAALDTPHIFICTQGISKQMCGFK